MRIRDNRKEETIREKALELIVEKGFDGFSMHTLAKAAAVSPATIYIYYQNREHLLNMLYKHVQLKFIEVALKNFNPELSFEQGLWVQWNNRLEFAKNYQVYFRFLEQFRNSPLIHHRDIDKTEMKETMKQFVINAIQRGEIQRVEPEIFWALAYGPLYSLIKFHISETGIMGNNFELNDTHVKSAFQMMLKSFKP